MQVEPVVLVRMALQEIPVSDLLCGSCCGPDRLITKLEFIGQALMPVIDPLHRILEALRSAFQRVPVVGRDCVEAQSHEPDKVNEVEVVLLLHSVQYFSAARDATWWALLTRPNS